MDDAQIVQLYWDRDEQAIPATSDKYGSHCTSIAKNILGNQEDAEVCVNDTYLNAWNSMPLHRPRILSTFLGKVTRNLSFNRYKHNTADIRGGGEMPTVLEELSDLVSGKDDVEQAFDQKELTKAIDTFLDRLSPKKRSLFISRYWYTDNISEIAVRHNMNDSRALEGTPERELTERIAIDTENLSELDTAEYVKKVQVGDMIKVCYLKEDSDISNGVIAVYEIIPLEETK